MPQNPNLCPICSMIMVPYCQIDRIVENGMTGDLYKYILKCTWYDCIDCQLGVKHVISYEVRNVK
jgi:hypothetical protein